LRLADQQPAGGRVWPASRFIRTRWTTFSDIHANIFNIANMAHENAVSMGKASQTTEQAKPVSAHVRPENR
jgi:hypothetical protein